MDQDLRERFVRLETESRIMHAQNQKELTDLRELIEKVAESQQTIANRLMKFDGGFWIIMTMAGILGFVISTFRHYIIGKIFP